MKCFYIIAMLPLFWSCSKEGFNTCGLVGEWTCCDNCPLWWNGAPENESWSIEPDGDLFIMNDYFGTWSRKWNTEGDCTELVLDPGTEDERKIKIDINGDEFVLHYGTVVGDRMFCRQ